MLNNFTGTEALIEVEHKTKVNFTTTCDLTVLSTSTIFENSWDGDVRFLAGDEEVLRIGLHPERTENLAVRNEVFKRGDNMWGFWWLDVEYPDFDEELRREYTFSFDVSKQALFLMCKGGVSILVYKYSTYSFHYCFIV